jgi:membrane-bound metal-dependent hydrolase YbcI (DUF457 family)
MLGRQHALAGTAAWLAVAPALAQSPGQVALGALVAAGGGMAPDFDQHGSTIGRTYGPITNVAARVIGAVSGGHRNGTHSLLGLAGLTALASAATVYGGPLRWILLWVLLGVACVAYRLVLPGHRRLTSIIHAVAMGLVTVVVLASGLEVTTVLVVGVGLGAATHILLDCLTKEGCPLLWPFSKARFKVALFTTGSSWTSHTITLVLMLLVGWLALAY